MPSAPEHTDPEHTDPEHTDPELTGPGRDPTDPINALETSAVLQRWGDRVRPTVELLVGRGRRRDALTGARLGHPAHPGLVLGPLACWGGAAVLDLLGGRAGRAAARRLTGLGVVLAGPALASGAADWLDTRGAEQRVGTAHALANNAALVLHGASWLTRRRRPGLGRALGLTGAAVAGGAGYLGGHLAYRRGVGVNTTAFQAGPTTWTRLGLRLPLATDDPVAVVSGDVVFVAVQGPGQALPYVLEDRCTHRGGPLHQGEVVGGCLVCPWHGSRFDLSSGAVVSGPASMPQPRYETRASGDDVEIRRTEPGELRGNPVGPASVSPAGVAPNGDSSDIERTGTGSEVGPEADRTRSADSGRR